MKNVMALLKLDFQLIKAWRLWVLMFLGIAVGSALLNQSGIAFIGMAGMFSAIIMTFPFEMSDKNNLNILYASLPTNRKSVVFARYLFALAFLVLAIVVGIAGFFIIDLIFGNDFDFKIMGLMLALAITLFLILVGWQSIFFFKLGYTKGRLFFWAPIVLLIIIINLPGILGWFNIDISLGDMFSAVINNALLSSLIALAVGATVFTISYFVSCKIYLKKDM